MFAVGASEMAAAGCAAVAVAVACGEGGEGGGGEWGGRLKREAGI